MKETVRDKTAIVKADLTIRFLSKKQCYYFIRLLLKETEKYHFNLIFDFQFKDEWIDGVKNNHYLVIIYDIYWAKDISMLNKLLEEVDYND